MIMEFIFTLLVAILWGYICCKMAEKRHRDPIIGALLGAIFGLFAVIGYAIAGDKE
jgi:F0F1-type ATP synthase assembly protein I